MKIAIIGASRGCGLATVKEALARGWSVNGLARNPEQAEFKDTRLAWYQGDARNDLLLEQTIKGCDAVVVALAAKTGRERVTVFSESIAAILTVMNRHGMKRLIFVSGIGAGDSKGSGGFLYNWIIHPFVLRRNYADKDRAEALLFKSHKEWTVVRPGILTNRAKAGKKVTALTNPADYRKGSIGRADVGWYICECIERGLHVNETPLLIT